MRTINTMIRMFVLAVLALLILPMAVQASQLQHELMPQLTQMDAGLSIGEMSYEYSAPMAENVAINASFDYLASLDYQNNDTILYRGKDAVKGICLWSKNSVLKLPLNAG